MNRNRYWLAPKIAVCTYAAVWTPFYVASIYLGYEQLVNSMNAFGWVPRFLAFIGIFVMALDICRSERSSDDKFWWIILGGIFAPVAVPAYWFMFGLEEDLETLRQHE